MKTRAEYTRAWRLANPEKNREQRLLQERRRRERMSPEKKAAYAAANRERARLRRQNNPESNYEYLRKSRGLEPPTRPRPEVCEACGRSPPPGRKKLHYDHCHRTNKFRGWLCARCNPSIGSLGDNVEGLRKALAYLERFEKEQTDV